MRSKDQHGVSGKKKRMIRIEIATRKKGRKKLFKRKRGEREMVISREKDVDRVIFLIFVLQGRKGAGEKEGEKEDI